MTDLERAVFVHQFIIGRTARDAAHVPGLREAWASVVAMLNAKYSAVVSGANPVLGIKDG